MQTPRPHKLIELLFSHSEKELTIFIKRKMQSVSYCVTKLMRLEMSDNLPFILTIMGNF